MLSRKKDYEKQRYRLSMILYSIEIKHIFPVHVIYIILILIIWVIGV